MAEIRVKETGTIKLFENDNTSSVTIASPASLGADRTVTLPDASVTLASGTMLATDGSGASLTALNASELGSGTVPTARLGSGTASSSTVLYGDQTYKAEPGGGVIQQVVQLYNTTHTSQVGGGYTSWHDISGMSQAITPIKASSKILVQVSLNYSGSSYYSAGRVLADIEGGGYNYIGDAAASGSRSPSFTGTMYFADVYVIRPDTGTYLWTPSYTLTDVITFKIQWGANPGGTMHLNRSKSATDSATIFICASSITLWEIN